MKNYQCKKCKTLLQSNSRPSALKCPSGSSHQWHDMGAVGTTTFQCQKCATVVQSKSRPSALNCPSNGSHNWNRL